MLNIETITVGDFAMNCYLVYDPTSMDGILIDPGLEGKRIIKLVEAHKVTVKLIFNTHAHIDHAADAGLVQKHFDVPFYLHREELPLLNSLAEQGMMFGIEVNSLPEVSGYLNHDEQVQFSNIHGRVIHTPGHSPGGLSLYFDGHVFVGDCLFRDSIGRTDLYKGDYNQLIDTIRTRLFSLPGDTRVYPGHGPSTTISREKEQNPFLQ